MIDSDVQCMVWGINNAIVIILYFIVILKVISLSLLCMLDDMVITGNDGHEITRLKENLMKEFEVKDLGQPRYFFGH